MTTMKYIYFILLIVISLDSIGQGFSDYDRMWFSTSVKQMDEFNRRFNMEEYTNGIDTADANRKLLNIITLFDGGNFETMNSATDSIFNQACEFAKVVVNESIKLNYSDTSWIARARCQGLLNGKKVLFNLYLSVARRNKNRYKWVISKAEGDIFNLQPVDTSRNVMITPNAHNINFMILSDLTSPSNNKNITRFGSGNPKNYQTAIFYYLVYNGNLKIEYVDNLEFIFFQVPGYVFTVKEFVRDTFNSGWLISELEKMDEGSKIRLLRDMRNN